MTWFRVDDKLGEHPKVRAIPRVHRRNAMGLWVLAGAWCASNVTTAAARDGNVPAYMLDELCAEVADADELARVGLWHATGHECDECSQPIDPAGWLFHQWASLQYTAEQAEAKRQAEAERARQYRERKKAERHASVTRDDDVSHAAVRLSRPDPTRPDPSLSSVGGPGRETLEPAPVTWPPRCTKHRDAVLDPGPCRGCMKAREQAEQAERDAADRAARARRDCARCGGSGWIEDVDGSPAAKCDHRPILEAVQ